MRIIDADYLNNVIEKWRNNYDKNSKEYQMITEFIHCLKAQRAVINIQGIIDDINDEKIIYSIMNKEDIQSSVIYNDGLDMAKNVIKNNINPDYRNDFIWNDTNKIKSTAQESGQEDELTHEVENDYM